MVTERIILVALNALSVVVMAQTQGEFDKYKRYDAKGNLIESVALFPDGTLAETMFSEYDSNNRVIRSYTVEAGSAEKKWINTYDYDPKGRLRRRNWYPSEHMVLYQYEVYEYDLRGNRIRLRRFDDEGHLSRLEEWKFKRGILIDHKLAPPPPEPIICP